MPAKFIESGIRETARLVYVVVARRKRNAKCGLLSLRMHLATLINIERMRYMRDRYILIRRLPFIIIKQYHENIVREICEYLEITKVLYESIHK